MMAAFYAGLVRLLTGAHALWMAEPPPCPAIFFANHTSNLDGPALWAALPSSLRARTRPVAAQDYWQATAARRYMATRVFNALLIERKHVTARNNPLTPMLEALDNNWSIIIFPEGGRGEGPEPGPFKSGLYHLAKDRPQIPLAPVFLENFGRILPKGEVLPAPLLTTVIIGAPIRLEPGEEKTAFLERARQAVWNLHRL